jgi:hypothetical protein
MATIRITEAANHDSAHRQGKRPWRKDRTWFPTRKGAAIGLASVLLLILCAHRLLTFIPQPLDSPTTLRPILYRWFSNFLKHYSNPGQAQQAWERYCIAALLVPTILAFWNYLYGGSAMGPAAWLRKVVGSRLLLFTSIAASLVVCQFPFLLAKEINPDETMFIAAAEKLFRDPIFFRAVDFATSGPLNVYPLMLPALFGISPDYVSTRLIALLLILVSIYVIYRALALLTDDAVARIAVLPAAGAFAVLRYIDFVHYSSEHVSFVLLSMALYICVRIFRNPQAYAWSLAGLGLLTAAAFLAKMQAVPLLGCVAMVAIAYVHGSGHAGRLWRPSLLFCAGLAPLLLLNGITCAAAGVWHDFWMEYIVANYQYVEAHGSLTGELARFGDFTFKVIEIRQLTVTLLAILAAYAYHKMQRGPVTDQALFLQMATVSGIVAVAADPILRASDGDIASYAGVLAILMLPGSLLLLYRNKDGSPALTRWFGFLTATVLAGAAAVAYTPHRLYRHYLLLLVFPLTVAMAWPVVAALPKDDLLLGDNEEAPARRSHSPLPFLLVFATLTIVCQLFEVGSPNFLAFSAVPAAVRAPESELIDNLTQPGGRITIWGWDGRPYLGAARVSALKDFIAAQLFLTRSEVRAYYRAAYLSGLQRHRPELFIDAIDTSHGGFKDRKSYGFDLIPDITSFVQGNYVHLLDAYGQRFYIRRDLAQSVAGIGEPRKCDVQAISCFEAGTGSRIPADLPPVQMPEHALVEATFTPEVNEALYATVFSNEGSFTTHQGFQFLHMQNDRYRLGVGWGPEGMLSQEVWLPQKRPVSLAIEFNGNAITIACNGGQRVEMRIPKRMQDSPGPITIGSWIGHQRPFVGNIQFFQIRDLGRGNDIRMLKAGGR